MKKRIGLLIAAIAALTTAALFSGAKTSRAGLSQAEWQGENVVIQRVAKLAVGDELDIPALTLSTPDGAKRASFTLSYPDGRVTAASPADIDSAGRYALRYFATVAGNTYFKEFPFTVDIPAITVGSDSSFSYGEIKSDYVENGTEGLAVSLAEGDALRAAPVFDMKNATKNDVIVSFFVLPRQMGNVDFRDVIITLTDHLDPTIRMRVSAHSISGSENLNRTWVSTAFNDQRLTSFNTETGKVVTSRWNTIVRHTFSGADQNGIMTKPLNSQQVSIAYDASENALYANDLMIAQFGNPAHYSNPYGDGFPSGMADLTITADDYVAASAHFVITRIGSISDLSVPTVEDNDAPEITLDCFGESPDAMPIAEVGKPYRLPAASAYDVQSGEVDVRATVYYNVSSPERSNVASDGATFTPARKGTYGIVYRATDAFGNAAEKLVTVRAVGETEPLTVAAGAHASSAEAGDELEAAEFTISGGSGKATTRIYASFGGERKDITAARVFRPDRAGEWKVEYVATDYIGNTASAAYTVSVTAGTAPRFIGSPTLPRMFIAGSSYPLPAFNAYDYSSGAAVARPATPSAMQDGMPLAIENGRITPAAGGPVSVSYTCGATVLPAIEVPVVEVFMAADGGRLHIENYLVGDNVTAESADSCIFSEAVSAGDAGWTFANSLVANAFNIRFAGVNGRTQYSSLVITLTDSEDSEKTLDMVITAADGTSRLVVGGKSYILGGSLAAGDEFTLSYSFGKIVLGGVTADAGGADFPSGRVWLSVTMKEASPGARWALRQIGNQNTNNVSMDMIRPTITVMGEYGGTFTAGATVTLPRAVAGDVLSPYVSLTLSVTAPDGTTIKSLDGTTLLRVDPSREYEISLSEIGQYRVQYSAEDGNGSGRLNWGYAVNVEDDVAPVITLSGGTEAAAVGDVLMFPDVTVSDNYSTVEEIIVIKTVVLPSGQRITLPAAGRSVMANAAGKYTFTVMAMDGAGNIGLVSRTVTVTG